MQKLRALGSFKFPGWMAWHFNRCFVYDESTRRKTLTSQRRSLPGRLSRPIGIPTFPFSSFSRRFPASVFPSSDGFFSTSERDGTTVASVCPPRIIWPFELSWLTSNSSARHQIIRFTPANPEAAAKIIPDVFPDYLLRLWIIWRQVSRHFNGVRSKTATVTIVGITTPRRRVSRSGKNKKIEETRCVYRVPSLGPLDLSRKNQLDYGV